MKPLLVIASMFIAMFASDRARSGTVSDVGTIALNGVDGRIDHLAIDATNQRLYVAALGNDTVEIIDLKGAKQAGRIEGLKKPQGVAVVADSHHLVVASGEDGKVRIYDENQKLLGTLDGFDDADNVRYDAEAKLIYVGYGDGALAVIDPEKIAKVADLKLDGHPESFQLETKGSRLFVNVPSANQIAVIDRKKRAVVAKFPMKEITANFPMALDEAHHRLFVGCRHPAKLVVIDTESGKMVTSLDCCGDTDDVFYDAASQHIYVSGGEGCISIFEQSDGDKYKLLGKIATPTGARTSFFNASTGVLYVAVPRRGNQRAELRLFKSK